VVEEGPRVFVRMEMCQGNFLQYAWSKPGGRIPESETAVWAAQLCTGLADIHALGILHRDIKPDNLLYTEAGVMKITDFGWCVSVRTVSTKLAGTFHYMAPEVLEELRPHTAAVDLWGAGATLMQILTGTPLLSSFLGLGPTGATLTDPQKATKTKICRLRTEIAERCPLPESGRPAHISEPCWDFLRKMLLPEPGRRITAPEALQHPWLHDGHRAEGGLRALLGAKTAGGTRGASDGSTTAPSDGGSDSPTQPLYTPLLTKSPRTLTKTRSVPPQQYMRCCSFPRYGGRLSDPCPSPFVPPPSPLLSPLLSPRWRTMSGHRQSPPDRVSPTRLGPSATSTSLCAMHRYT